MWQTCVLASWNRWSAPGKNKCSCMCNSCWFQRASTAHHLQVLTVLLYSARWDRWQHLDEDNGVEERAGHAGHQGQLPQEVRGVSLHHNPGTAPTETDKIDISALFQNKTDSFKMMVSPTCHSQQAMQHQLHSFRISFHWNASHLLSFSHEQAGAHKNQSLSLGPDVLSKLLPSSCGAPKWIMLNR